jgi:hypothetical protein
MNAKSKEIRWAGLSAGRRLRTHMSVLIAAFALSAHGEVDVSGGNQVPSGLAESVRAYFGNHREDPTRYLVRQFSNHDIVFVGEMHGVQQNLEFLQALIPNLYAAGVYNLGYEFSLYKDQERIDRLLTSDRYDPHEIETLLLGIDLTYVVQEYADVYKAAWQFNRTLPPTARHFRIVALNLDTNSQTPTDAWGGQRLNSHDTDNIFWAQVISKEILAKHEKALIYSGSGHSYTRFFFQRTQDNSISAGNLVHNFIPGRVATIWLHGDGDRKALTRQIDDVIEAGGGGGRAFGFDTRDTPFGQLPLSIAGYVFGKQKCGPFTLGDVADGYIWLAPRTKLNGVRFIKGFINSDNVTEIERQWRRQHPRNRPYTKDEIEEAAADNWLHLQDVFK